jgi:ABC-type amino acid transport substrate-binding protein
MSADLAAGALDAALVWGPQAGYFVDHAAVPLAITPAVPPHGFALPFEFAIAIGVREDAPELRRDLDAAIASRAAAIAKLLDAYHVPRAAAGTGTAAADAPQERRP